MQNINLNFFEMATDNDRAEYKPEDGEKQPKRPFVPRGSWWQSSDKKRLLVVTGSFFESRLKPAYYEFFEKGKTGAINVDKDVFDGLFRAKDLVRIWD